MEEKKKQAVESGSLYMTLDTLLPRPCIWVFTDRGKRDSRYISNNVRSHTDPVGNLLPNH